MDTATKEALTTEWQVGDGMYGIECDGLTIGFRSRKLKAKQWKMGIEPEHINMLATILNQIRPQNNRLNPYNLPVHPDLLG